MLIKQIQRLFRHSQAVRFLVIGTVNTCFSFGMYATLIFFGLHYALANLLTLITGILLGFKSQGSIVFRRSDNRLLGRFILSWAFIFISTSILIGYVMRSGFNAYTSGILALPFSTALSFFAQKYFVFRKRRPCRSFNDND